jgi:hypothetical protein
LIFFFFQEKMETKKLEAECKGEVVNEKQIYFAVTGPPTCGRVLGMGAGIKPRDVYGITSSSQGCRKGCQKDRLKEKEEFEACLKEIEDKRLTKKKEMEDMRFAEKKRNGGKNYSNGSTDVSYGGKYVEIHGHHTGFYASTYYTGTFFNICDC